MNQASKDLDPKSYPRFAAGERTPRTEEERRAFHTYALIRNEIRSGAVPGFDADRLAQHMMRRMRGSRRRSLGLGARIWEIPAPVHVVAGFLTICICLFIVGRSLLPIDRGLVQRVHFSAENTSVEQPAPRLWMVRLMRGTRVTVPEKHSAEMLLSDGSVVHCSAGTQIAVRYGDKREIRLDAGSIIVHAAHVPESIMTIDTPIADVEVIGTIFSLDVVQ